MLGFVHDANGGPVRGANIRVMSETDTVDVQSNSDGRFRARVTATRGVRVRVRAFGYRDLFRSFRAAGNPVIQAALALPPPYPLAGVTVTAVRLPLRINETSAAMTVLGSRETRVAAGGTLDAALRQAPGFTLFRRSDSRTANPTTQGIFLRGIGGSGASRAVVFQDGVPLNDPFGGWVAWARVPRLSVERVEVRRGSGSDVRGSGAMSGSVHVVSPSDVTSAIAVESSARSNDTYDQDVRAAAATGGWAGSVIAETARNGGYVAVDPASRGPVDDPLTSRHRTAILTGTRQLPSGGIFFVRGSYFDEARGNGTPLQTNDTRTREVSSGVDLTTKAGALTARVYAGREIYDQSFTAVDSARATERLTRLQAIPTNYGGAAAQWVGPRVGPLEPWAAVEGRTATASVNELVSAAGAWSVQSTRGGERAGSAAGGALATLPWELRLNASAWLERWWTMDGRRVATGVDTTLSSRAQTAFSPRLALVRSFGPWTARASAARGFRAPSLNELYRSFRVGNVVTRANERLGAERSTSWEIGAERRTDAAVFSSTLFWTDVGGAIANVTLSQSPSLIVRERENLARTRSRGMEIEARTRVDDHWTVGAAYQFVEAWVRDAGPERELENKRLPQVPAHQGSLRLGYAPRPGLEWGLSAQGSSRQFDDDANQFPLRPYVTMDAWATARLARGVELWGTGENLFGTRVDVARTPVLTVGPPRGVRMGLRIGTTG
ncbi:MAG: TonB-dependent receptor [Bacteroidota bacterium]